MKAFYIIARIMSIFGSALLAFVLGHYISLIIPVYETIFSSKVEHSFGVTILIILNEFMDVAVILFLCYVMLHLPIYVFNATKGAMSKNV